MTTTHVLKTSVGVTVEMAFNESNAHFACQWDPAPPFTKKIRAAIIKEYIPWRDEILSQWSKKTGRKVTILTI